MRTKLIFNPQGGRKGGISFPRPTLDEVAHLLRRYEIGADVRLTERPGHATELAAEAVAAGYERVLVAGGDGTIHEAIQPLVGTDVTLGILPMGSVMNISRALAIPRDLEGAIQTIRMEHVITIDVGEASGLYFLEAAGVGFDAGIFQQANLIDQGQWASVRELAQFVQTFRPGRLLLEVDHRLIRLRALMVLVANTPFYGAGLRVAHDAKINDGWLDVVVFSNTGKLDLLRHWIRSLGPGRPYLPATRFYRGREVVIRARRDMPAHADSYPLEVKGELRFRSYPNALQVYAGFPASDEVSAFIEHQKPVISLPALPKTSDWIDDQPRPGNTISSGASPDSRRTSANSSR